jgi:23S rRNA (uracil1939-C5)-methyltransferase
MQGKTVPFTIESIDSLGQGVSKKTDKITFIPKVLPGEKGEASILSEKKGVAFGSLKTLHSSSPERIEPYCVHFQQCPSCHFQHTNYDQEIEFKKANLQRMFNRLEHPPISLVPAIRRSHYRNRIQLHYNKKLSLLGMLDAKANKIIPVKNCQIGRESVLIKLQELYQDECWIKLAEREPSTGHVEIYEKEDQVHVTWNKDYAEGGFSQVFDEMNQALREILTDWSTQLSTFGLLDLFAGNGNLSNKLNYSRRLCVDTYPTKVDLPFLSQNLYAADAIAKIKKITDAHDLIPDIILLDPPRSGLKGLSQWMKIFHPKYFIYVSCDPHTLARDLQEVSGYKIISLQLIDFFPSTFHYETLVILERD